MRLLARIAIILATVSFTAQPCIAAAAGDGIRFDLERHAANPGAQAPAADPVVQSAAIASASLSLAASQQTAAEQEEPPERSGPGTTTWLVIGGVVLLVLVAVVVAGSTPSPGPDEGAFD